MEVGRQAAGGALAYERRLLDDTAAVGFNARVSVADEDTQIMSGLVGKYWLGAAKILVLAEADGIRQTFEADGLPARNQLVGHLNLTYFPITGLMIGATAERYDENLEIKEDARDSANLTIQYFPWAHFEVVGMGRAERVGGGDTSLLGMLMLHYYL
jgi:hypothetical protein